MVRHRIGGLSGRLGRPWLLAAFTLTYALLYVNRHWLHWPLSTLLNSYLADVLALPLVLSAALWLMRHVYFGSAVFTLPLSWIIASWTVFSIWFELLLPHLQPGATGDISDILAYALGGVVFWRWLNKPAIRMECTTKSPASTV
jgi:hypothetical protein